MTDPFAGDIEIVLDLRDYRPTPSRPQDFALLWEQLEPALLGRSLTARSRHELDTPADGSVGIEVTRVRPDLGAVRQETRFSVVAVRERPELRYRCRLCAEAGKDSYGPFLCRECQQAGKPDRVCDDHVVVLDGSLQPTCPDHWADCAASGCAERSAFRCAGPRCHRRTAWCDRHRHRHPRDEDLDYCPACYDRLFPVCEELGCQGVGTVACEFAVDRTGHQCGRRSCTRHAHRWQVYGGERVGLGLCQAHRRNRMTADDVLFQIVVGSANRRPATRPPTLAGFGHNLRNAGHRELALDYPALLNRLERLYAELQGSRVRIRDAEKHIVSWRRQATAENSARDDGERLLEQLRALVLQHDRRYGDAIASTLRLAQYKAATGQRQALLFVDVAEELRGLFAGTGRRHLVAYSERLGVQVMLEGGGKRR